MQGLLEVYLYIVQYLQFSTVIPHMRSFIELKVQKGKLNSKGLVYNKDYTVFMNIHKKGRDFTYLNDAT